MFCFGSFEVNHGAAWLNLINGGGGGGRGSWKMSIDAKFQCQSESFSEAFSVGRRPPGGCAAKKLEESAKSAERFLQPWISERNIKQQRLSMTSSRGIKCTLHHCGASLLWMLLCSRKKTSGKKNEEKPFGGEVKTNSLSLASISNFLCNLRGYDADCWYYVLVPLRDCNWTTVRNTQAFDTLSNDRSTFLKPSLVHKNKTAVEWRWFFFCDDWGKY